MTKLPSESSVPYITSSELDFGGELNFDTWTTLLRNDCAAHDKVREFDGLGERILKILYENGLDPTVEALVRDGINGKPHKTSR